MTLTAYDHLKLASVPVPQPGPGEVLCRIKSVAICGKPGQYAVQYSVKNTNKPYRATTKKIMITVTGNVNAQINTSAETVTVPTASTDQTVIDAVRAVVTINDNGTVVTGTNTTVTVVLVKDQAGTVTAANVSYKGKNGVTVTKQIKVQFEQATTGTTEQQTTSTESTAQPQQ